MLRSLTQCKLRYGRQVKDRNACRPLTGKKNIFAYYKKKIFKKKRGRFSGIHFSEKHPLFLSLISFSAEFPRRRGKIRARPSSDSSAGRSAAGRPERRGPDGRRSARSGSRCGSYRISCRDRASDDPCRTARRTKPSPCRN